MIDVVVFNTLIPCTENASGIVHPPSKFDAWMLETADRFGGVTVVGLALQGLWFDPELPREANPIEDHSNWYKIGVAPARVDELREYARETARGIATRAGIEQGLILAPEHERERPKAPTDSSMISVTQAAALIGITRAAVYKAIENKALPALHIGNVTVVDREAAVAYKHGRAREAPPAPRRSERRHVA